MTTLDKQQEIEEALKSVQVEEAWYTPKQVAELLGIKPTTLAQWRVKGLHTKTMDGKIIPKYGPPYIKVDGSRLVRYPRTTLIAWQKTQELVYTTANYE